MDPRASKAGWDGYPVAMPLSPMQQGHMLAGPPPPPPNAHLAALASTGGPMPMYGAPAVFHQAGPWYPFPGPPLPQQAQMHPAWASVVPPTVQPGHPSIPAPLLPIHQHENGTVNHQNGDAASTQDGSSTPLDRSVSSATRDEREIWSSGGLKSPSAVGWVSRPTSRSSSMIPADTNGNMTPSHQLNKFASVYIPSWLRDISAPETLVPLAPLPPSLPPNFLHSLYTLEQLASPWPDITAFPSILSLPPFPDDPKQPIPPLEPAPDAFRAHWTALLSLELQSISSTAASQKLHRVPVVPYRAKRSDPNAPPDAETTWQLSIPGIREDTPRILINDTLILRGLYPSLETASRCALEARVTGMVKREGKVYIQCPHLAEQHRTLELNEGEGLYNVDLKASSDAICSMQTAVRAVAAGLESPQAAIGSWLFPKLFPKADDGNVLETEWMDENLNLEQKQAVSMIVKSSGRVPLLIAGPPGTGKTKTTVEAVLQILKHDATASVLVCAPSNAATDTVALRLKAHLSTDEMLRLQRPTRSFAEVPGELMPYCLIEESAFAVPSAEKLLGYRVVAVSCLDADILVEGRLTNAELLRAELSLSRQLHRKAPFTGQYHWTHLLVDEAGQASEPETFIPMSVIMPNVDAPAGVPLPKFVLCGDINQLPAIISSARARQAGLDDSMMDRLSRLDLYDHRRKSTPAFVGLIRNYRSHPGILLASSTMFYGDRLEPKAFLPSARWRGLPNPKLPIKIIGVEAAENWVEEGASYYNTAEIEQVIANVLDLLSDKALALKPEEIGVISPWREQVWKLRDALRKIGQWQVNVGHIEAYQGAEYRCIIISCVRSERSLVQRDKKFGTGLIFEPKRFNVAITRAKEALIIIGNMNTHKMDPYFNGLLQIATRHNLYTGPQLGIEASGQYTSRLESHLYATSTSNGDNRHDDHNNDEEEDDDDGLSMHQMMISGSVAREAMID